MTIAAGILCEEGVVLAADGRMTGPTGKYSGRKIFPITRAGLTVLLAGSGPDVVFLRRVRDELDHRLVDGMSADDAAAQLELGLDEVFSKHIRPSPRAQDLQLLQFLAAIWSAGYGCSLYQTSETVVSRVTDRVACIGYGQDLGHYIAASFSMLTMHIRGCEILAAYLIEQAKEHVNYCGGTTRLMTLLVDGTTRERVGNAAKHEASMLKDALLRLHTLLMFAAQEGPTTPQTIEIFTKSLHDTLLFRYMATTPEYKAKFRHEREEANEYSRKLREAYEDDEST